MLEPYGSVRPIMLSEHPADGTHSVYVKGQVVTTVRFEQTVDPSKTKMMGWEGRLEPLAVVRNKVILEPIRDLHRDEGIPLVVTLTDGTEIPFLVKPPWSKKDRGWPPILDQQIDVFKDRESYAAMHAALMDALKKNDSLSEARFAGPEGSPRCSRMALTPQAAVRYASTRRLPPRNDVVTYAR